MLTSRSPVQNDRRDALHPRDARTRRPCGLASIALGATLLACAGVQAAERSDPKIVYLGAKDSPRPAQFAAEVGALERANTPIDGTSINFVARYPDGNFAKPFNRAFAGTLEELRVRGPLQRSWFERGADDIRAANPRYITENFLRLQSRPGSVDWFDDAAWVQIVDTFRHAAFAASEAGLKGIFFDPEPYLEGFAQFEYLLQTGFGTRDYEAYVEQARLRGREVMSAMQEEFPDLTILSLFLNAYPVVPRFRSETTADAADPRLSLVRDPYALLPPFVDGWLDVANPDVTFVDGNETAYYYNDPIDFDVAAARIREDGAALVSPGNREKYARQVQVGSAVFLDAYQDAFPEQFRPPLPEGSTWPELFEQNTRNALRSADEYVWLYGETARFWTIAAGENGAEQPLWSEKLPFEVETLRAARGAARIGELPGTAEEVAARRGERARTIDFARGARDALLADLATTGGSVADVDRIVNGDFASDLSDWGFFNDANRASEGDHAWIASGDDAPGALATDGARAGASFQSIDITPGEVLWIEADATREGWGEPSVSLGFRGPDGRFLDEGRATFFLPAWTPVAARGALGERWQRIEGAVAVPPEATKLVVSLGVDGQRAGTDDTVAFDDVTLLSVGSAADIPAASPTPAPAPAPTPAPDATLLTNPGFEQELDEWQVSSTEPPALVAGASGRAVAIEAANTGVVQTVPIAPGQGFALSAAARVEGGAERAFVGVLFRDATGRNVPGAFSSRRVTGGDWSGYDVSGAAPPEAVEIGVFAWQEGASGTLFADDFSLELR